MIIHLRKIDTSLQIYSFLESNYTIFNLKSNSSYIKSRFFKIKFVLNHFVRTNNVSTTFKFWQQSYQRDTKKNIRNRRDVSAS